MLVPPIAIRVPGPLRRPSFRLLWLGMTTSYAGDRLQGLAQAWLVASATNSALGVGLIWTATSVPLLLTPLGGVIADRFDRHRLLILGQFVGATSTAIVTFLVLAHLVAVWHIYLWAFINGLVTLVSRPAYKVALTEAVPLNEVRSAVALNSTTETGSLVLTNALGSLLIGILGLPIAFALNVVSYAVAAMTLLGLGRSHSSVVSSTPSATSVLSDLGDGIAYCWRRPALRNPLLLTLVTVATAGPLIGILPAIVHARGGSIVDLGLISAGLSLGSFLGAVVGGMRDDGHRPTRRYAQLGLLVAAAVTAFAVLPLGLLSTVPLAAVGFVLFSEAVWNTSRVRRLAEPGYQARVQSLTSMAFNLGITTGTLSVGALIDRFGITTLLGSAIALVAVALAIIVGGWQREAVVAPVPATRWSDPPPNLGD